MILAAVAMHLLASQTGQVEICHLLETEKARPAIDWSERTALPLLSNPSGELALYSFDAPESFTVLPVPLRTEVRDLDFTLGVHAVEWVMFGARKNIESGGRTWNLVVDDALGVGVDLSLRVRDLWFEQFFDYSFGVLGTTDRLTFRTLGLNVGCNYFNSDSERLAFFGGVLLNYANLDLKEGGVSIPGDLKPSVGGQAGLRYARVIHEGGNGSPKAGFSAEFAFRYMRLHFQGDQGVSSEKIGGPGVALTLGAFVQF